MTDMQRRFRRKLVGFVIFLIFLIFAVMGAGVAKAIAQAQAVATEEAPKSTHPDVIKYAFLAAAIVVGVGSLGAGVAVGYVGAAAMGTIGEKPELFGRALIFVGLAEGIAIYGLIIAIMILGKV